MSTDPHGHTQCAGWTVHELTAHLAAGPAEMADLIELELAGESSRPTRPFDEREAPYRALPSARVRRAFVEESLRAAVGVSGYSTPKRAAADPQALGPLARTRPPAPDWCAGRHHRRRRDAPARIATERDYCAPNWIP